MPRLIPNTASVYILATLLLLSSCTMMTQTTDRDQNTLLEAMQSLTDENQIESAALLSLPLKQAWLDELDKNFEPGLAQIHAEPTGLMVLATLKDLNIHNSADGFNQRMWKLGDVFEIFIEVSPKVYYEFHVTPENKNLFLRWSPELFSAVGRGEASLKSALIHNADFLKSHTQVDHEKNLWTVSVLIPYESLGITPANTSLRVAFSRYDTTNGKDKAVLSATPDFPRASYHIREAWHPIQLKSLSTQ